MGKQWMWKFAYPEGPNAIDVLHVPATARCACCITSRDVIHSFFVPAFRIKQDVCPAATPQTWFEATKPGRYQIFCAEYCGARPLEMRGEVVVHEPAEDFDEWIAGAAARRWRARQDARADEPAQVAPPGSLVEQGQQLAGEQGCLKCHTRRRRAAHRPHLAGPVPAQRDARRRRDASSPTRPTSPSR